jgi:tRNA splicing ligase
MAIEETFSVIETPQGNVVKQTKDGSYYMDINPNGHIIFICSSDDEKFMVIKKGVTGTPIFELPASTNS